MRNIVVYRSPSVVRIVKSRRLQWAGHVARTGETRNAYSVLVGKPHEKCPLVRPAIRWEDGIKIDLKETGCEECLWTVTSGKILY
jgi:hypothetical protein